MGSEPEFTDEFEAWWNGLDVDTQDSVDVYVRLLEDRGTNLGFPHSSDVRQSKYGHMRELRVQHRGEPIRILYAFDPRRCPILLIGGSKVGNDRWYKEFVPKADELYKQHLEQLQKEGLIDG
jgi:hypothetical protein